MTATIYPFPPAVPTEPIDFPWAKPPVTATYRTPHARARHIAHRVARSPFLTDVRTRLPWLPTGIGALTVTYFFVLVVRGLYVLALMAGVAK